MKKMQLIGGLAALLALVSVSNAQPQNPGNDPTRAKEYFTIFTDDVKSKNYKGASVVLPWLLQNAPAISKNIYIQGVEVYRNLANVEKEPAKKRVYQDSLLTVYDLRLKQYPTDEGNILNRKGLDLMALTPEREGAKACDLYDFYQKVYKLNGENTYPQNVQYYLYAACQCKAQKGRELSDEKVSELYEQLLELSEKKVAAADAQKAVWEETRNYLSQQAESCIKIDCEFVEKQLAPKYRANPKDTVLTKKIVSVMAKQCSDDPLFMEALESLTLAAPTCQRLSLMAKVKKSKGDEKAYMEYMEKMFTKGCASARDKADYNLGLAQDLAKKGQYGAAKAKALEATQIDPAVSSNAYTFIATMMMNSASVCKGTEPNNPCHAKAVFIAAYNWYQKAGNAAGMQNAKRYYPTREEIFSHSMGGKAVNVGCWIGETVIIPEL